MKKILCCLLMMTAMVVSATAQTQSIGPPEQDIGYTQAVATLSLDGQTVIPFVSKSYIVDWQMPVMLNMEVSQPSALVADAYSFLATQGEVGTGLVSFRWPNSMTEMINRTDNYKTNSAFAPTDSYLFTAAWTERS